jgi:hypothetical protein
MHADISRFKENLAAGGDAGVVQVLQNLMLRINGDSFSASELLKIDTVTTTAEAQLDSVVDQAFGFQARSKAHFREQVDRSLLEYSGADALLGILPAAILDYDRLNSLEI